MSVESEILDLWKSVKRPNVENLIKWITESDFFKAPASVSKHGSFEGGLAYHTLMVYKVLEVKLKMYSKINIDPESAIICALGHDLCKINFYSTGTKNVKENGQWIQKTVYIIDDKFPLGHGEKSVALLQSFIFLKPIEQLAIRWHMGPFEPNTMFYGYSQPFQAALNNPLVALLFTADLESSRIVEGITHDKQ